MPYVNNIGADHPPHSCSLISTFVVYCLDSMIFLVSMSEITSLYLTVAVLFLVTWFISFRPYMFLLHWLDVWNLEENAHFFSQNKGGNESLYCRNVWFDASTCLVKKPRLFKDWRIKPGAHGPRVLGLIFRSLKWDLEQCLHIHDLVASGRLNLTEPSTSYTHFLCWHSLLENLVFGIR